MAAAFISSTGYLNFNVDEQNSRYPEMRQWLIRKQSFRECSIIHHYDESTLAYMGLFYSVADDCVKCFNCGLVNKCCTTRRFAAKSMVKQHLLFMQHCSLTSGLFDQTIGIDVLEMIKDGEHSSYVSQYNTWVYNYYAILNVTTDLSLVQRPFELPKYCTLIGYLNFAPPDDDCTDPYMKQWSDRVASFHSTDPSKSNTLAFMGMFRTNTEKLRCFYCGFECSSSESFTSRDIGCAHLYSKKKKCRLISGLNVHIILIDVCQMIVDQQLPPASYENYVKAFHPTDANWFFHPDTTKDIYVLDHLHTPPRPIAPPTEKEAAGMARHLAISSRSGPEETRASDDERPARLSQTDESPNPIAPTNDDEVSSSDISWGSSSSSSDVSSPSLSENEYDGADGGEDDDLLEAEKFVDVSCQLCLTKRRAIVFLPCGHVTTCKTCSLRISSCPSCRGKIRKRFKVFL